MVTFVLGDDGATTGNLTKIDMDSVPMVDEIVEIKGHEYVVRSRRWKAGRLGASATVVVRSVIETAV